MPHTHFFGQRSADTSFPLACFLSRSLLLSRPLPRMRCACATAVQYSAALSPVCMCCAVVLGKGPRGPLAWLLHVLFIRLPLFLLPLCATRRGLTQTHTRHTHAHTHALSPLLLFHSPFPSPPPPHLSHRLLELAFHPRLTLPAAPYPAARNPLC